MASQKRITPVVRYAIGLILLLTTAATVFGQSNAGVEPGGTPGPTRRALIVGNGDYERQRLTNPTNDARDLAEALEETGFEVLLRTDRTVAQMEEDLREFREVIQPGDVTLFFYAGHGVQVDGRNYLLPINNGDIQDNTELRRKAIDAHAYVETMVDAGAGLNIVMLDACRDNPLPAATRGGNRGLSAMDPPRGSETVIVFATQAGDVAEDGDGDNSTFTTALLEEIHTPDVELLSLFNRIGSDVRDQTGGNQIPTIYSEPLSQPFYFVTAEMIAARARAESNAAQAEVEVLEDQIAAYQARIDAAANARERRELEVEQQRQQALLAAQRIEAQNLEEEAARREREAREAEERRREREEQAVAAQAQQEELARLASARRQEMERLAADARSEDPDILIATIERLETVLEEVEDEYDAAWRRTRSEMTASFQPQFAQLNDQEPEIWETDEEFNTRITQERSALRRQQTRRINATQAEMESQEEEQTAEIRSQLDDALSTLRRSTWTLKGSDVELEIGEYDRNARQWPFTVSSTVDWLPLQNYRVVEDFSRRSDPREAIIELNEAVEAGALSGEITWKIERDEENDRYLVVAYTVRVRNIVSDQIVESEYPRQGVAALTANQRVAGAESFVGTVRISVSGFAGLVTIDVDGEEVATDRTSNEIVVAPIEEGERVILARDDAGKSAIDVTNVIANRTVTVQMRGRDGMYVEGGTFRMGSTDGHSDERPVHTVSLDSFFMMRTEVTFAEYDRFARATGRDLPDDEGWGRGTRPAINVSWYDAIAYANWLSGQEGLDPAYRVNGSNVRWIRLANGWRLPTEAEWEYAARGGQDARDTTYAGGNSARAVAWYGGNSGGRTRPVGQKRANELGLYDMSGNVREWCWDRYGNGYSDDAPRSDPTGAFSGSTRVFRGGDWNSNVGRTRVANRSYNGPGNTGRSFGFRLVRDGVHQE